MRFTKLNSLHAKSFKLHYLINLIICSGYSSRKRPKGHPKRTIKSSSKRLHFTWSGGSKVFLPQPGGGRKVPCRRPVQSRRINFCQMARFVAHRNGAHALQGTGGDVPELQLGNQIRAVHFVVRGF